MKNNAKHFALQLGSLLSLYASLGALISLLFGVITVTFPDPADSFYVYDNAASSIRFSIAMLVVLFPTYIVLTRLVQKHRREEKEEYLTLTKWLVYLSLLVGGAVLLGDLIAVINGFLNGELVMQFVLKALTVLVVVGAAFVYYLFDARGYWQTHEQHSIMYGGGALLLVIIAIIFGFRNIEPPAEVREMRIDARQVNDLQQIQSAVITHYVEEGALPETIDDAFGGRTAPEAPAERTAYTYTITDDTTFELCATFAAESDEDMFYPEPAIRYIDESIAKNTYSWAHGTGEWCYTRHVEQN